MTTEVAPKLGRSMGVHIQHLDEVLLGLLGLPYVGPRAEEYVIEGLRVLDLPSEWKEGVASIKAKQ